MQTLFLRGPSATLRMILLVIASLVLMTVDHRWNHLEVVRQGLSYVLYPVQYAIDMPIRLFHWGDEVLTRHNTLLEENRELRELQLQSRVQLQRLDVIEKENDRLRSLLSATPKTTEDHLIAAIVSVDVNPYRDLIIINKGTNDGVYLGQPIIDALGVMGQVIHTNALNATVMLITDVSHAIPVQVNRTGQRGVLFGTGKSDYLDLRHIPHNADIRRGDRLVTSGLGGQFPPNYPVAEITYINRVAGETFVDVRAEPLAMLDNSREVLLVWAQGEEMPIPESVLGSEAGDDETGDEVSEVDGSAENESSGEKDTQRGDGRARQ